MDLQPFSESLVKDGDAWTGESLLPTHEPEEGATHVGKGTLPVLHLSVLQQRVDKTTLLILIVRLQSVFGVRSIPVVHP